MGCRKALWPDTAIAHKCDEKGAVITAKPHSRNFLKSETKQNGLAQWLDVFVRMVGLLISKGTISEEDYGAHGFTGLFNFADIFQAFVALLHIANPQVQTESFMRLLERKASQQK